MDKVLKNVINKTIELEYKHTTNNFKYVTEKNKELAAEQRECELKVEKISEELEKVVPVEYKNLIEELVNTSLQVTSIEAQMLFKEGVILGLTDLDYLRKVGLEIICI